MIQLEYIKHWFSVVWNLFYSSQPREEINLRRNDTFLRYTCNGSRLLCRLLCSRLLCCWLLCIVKATVVCV